MGPYGSLPVTGFGAIAIGGLAIKFPLLALAAAAIIIVGFLLIRFARPAAVNSDVAPGAARHSSTLRRIAHISGSRRS